MDQQFRDQVLFERLPASARALMRSQAGPGAGTALSVVPTSYLTQIPPHLFRVILLRRLRLPLLPSLLRCRCGRPIDSFGHHRAACARSGVLGRKGFALESATARICREAGGRVGDELFDERCGTFLCWPPTAGRLDVVVDGLHLFGGCQLAVDTTLVCAMHCDGTPHDGAPNRDGVVLEVARRRKERRYPQLVGPRSRRALVCRNQFLSGANWRRQRLARKHLSFRSVQSKHGGCDGQAFLLAQQRRLWRLHCSRLKVAHSADGDTLSCSEVLANHRYDGLAP